MKTVFNRNKDSEYFYELYIDVYVDKEYIFTVKNFYYEMVSIHYKPNEIYPDNYEIIENYQNSSYYDNDNSFK